MKFILIYMIFISSGGTFGKGGTSIETNSQEFYTQKACVVAGKEIKAMKFKKRRGRDWITIKAFCVPKGREV